MGKERKGRSPGPGAAGAPCSAQKAGGGQGPARSAPLGSVPGAAVPPLPRPPHRRARRPRSPRSARSLQPKGGGGSSPAAPRPPLIASDSDDQQGRGSQRWFPGGDQSSVWSCSNRTGSDVRCPCLRRHLRPWPCPCLGYYWLCLSRAK